MKKLTVTDWIFAASVIVLLIVVFAFSCAGADEIQSTGSWRIYQDYKDQLESDSKSTDTSLCTDIEKTIESKEIVNPRTLDTLRLLASKCWVLRGNDYDNAANILLPCSNSNPKILRLWFNLEKSYLDGQTRYCRSSATACSGDDKAELARRYRALLPVNEKLGLLYKNQIEFGIMVNK